MCRPATVLARARSLGTSTLAATVTVVGLVAALHVASPTAPAAAQQPDGDGSVAITISEMTGVLGPGSRPAPDPEGTDMTRAPVDLDLRVLVENDGDIALTDLTLVVEIHPPVADRAELRRALDGDLSAFASAVRSVPVLESGRLAAGDLVGVSQTVDSDQVRWDEGHGAVRPVRIAVIRGLEVLDEVVVPLVWLQRVPDQPVLTTMVWPYDAPPMRSVGGAYRGGADRELRPGGRLDVLLRTLERSDSPPVTFAPAPHLLEDLADRADGFVAHERQDDGTSDTRTVAAAGSEARLADGTLQRVRELSGRLPLSPLAGTYAGADLTALHAAGGAVTDLASDAAVDGRRRLQRQLGRDIDATTHLLQSPVDLPVLDLVPGEHVLVPSASTTDPPVTDEPPVGNPVRTVRAPSGRLVSVVVADPYLEELLDGADHVAGPVATANAVLAHTAMTYLESPGRGDRALLLLPPADWNPSPATATRVLDGLLTATWLELTGPDQLVRGGGTGDVEFAEPPLGPFPSEFSGALDRATLSLTAVGGSLPDGETRLVGRSLSELEDALLRASSRWLRGSSVTESEAEALVRDIQRAADETFGDIEVATGAITLTSDSGQIPITVQRTRGEAITVAVEVTSQGRLSWPEGRRSEPILLEPGGSQTVSFLTQARSTGTFPVTVRVTDPAGVHELGRSGMTVRSTAISGTALSLIGLAILILLLLGALRRPGHDAR